MFVTIFVSISLFYIYVYLILVTFKLIKSARVLKLLFAVFVKPKVYERGLYNV